MFDAAYLVALRDRSTEAENHLLSYFAPAVRSKLRARLRSPELVEDAFQETFLRVFAYFRANKTLDNPSRLDSFVHSVCHNVALEVLRAATRQDQYPENCAEPKDAGLDPERQAASRECRELVRRHVTELPHRDRELLRRIFLEEEDKDLVCKDMSISRDYLRLLLHRARQRLKTAVIRSQPEDGTRKKAMK